MSNWVPNITLISNGEDVNALNTGRVMGALKQRTDFLYERLTNLQVQNLTLPSIPCSSSAENYKIGYVNPANGLVDLANGGNTVKAVAVGIILNKRSSVGGFVCDLLIKGKLDLPPSYLSSFVESGTWTTGATAYLSTTNGKVTFTAPPLSVPMGIALTQDSSLNYGFIFDSDPYLNLQHRHIREVFSWILVTDGGTGAYQLAYEPTLPSSVFAMIDANPLQFDDYSVGGWTSPGDPDFTVSGTTIQVYSPHRFEVNPFDPKLEVWYSHPFGNSGGVTGIVAGRNITLASCSVQSNVASGIVTINAVPSVSYLPLDNTSSLVVKSITVDPVTKSLVLTSGNVVNKITPGIGVYLTGDSPSGQGSFTLNARRDRNSYELLKPESIFLENSKQNFLFDRWHVHTLEYSQSQEANILFKLPEYTNPAIKPKLILEYLVSSQAPSNAVELSINFMLLTEGTTTAVDSFTAITNLVPILVTSYRKKVSHSIDLDLVPIPNSSLLVVISRTSGVLDTYAEDFDILHTRLRITPQAI